MTVSVHFPVPAAPPDRVPREGETINLRAKVPDYKIDPETGCWIWQKGLDPKGRGAGHMHRRYWERANGPIPEGWEVHHLCRTLACINPDHLKAMPQREHHIEHFLGDNGYSLDFIKLIREEGRKPMASSREVGERYGVHFTTVIRWWNSSTWADLIGDGPVVTPGVVCGLDGCENVCRGRRDKRYCCREHQAEAGQRRRAERKKAQRTSARLERIQEP